jgi:hypothetical protein
MIGGNLSGADIAVRPPQAPQQASRNLRRCDPHHGSAFFSVSAAVAGALSECDARVHDNLRRELGPAVCAALEEDGVIEIMVKLRRHGRPVQSGA